MGQEFYDLGVHVALAPVTGGPLGRAPRNGRNWEGKHVVKVPFCQISALIRSSGSLPQVGTLTRTQRVRRVTGVLRVSKMPGYRPRQSKSEIFAASIPSYKDHPPRHFLAYEQETSRNLYINKSLGGIPSLPSTGQLPISSNLDDATTHETYLWSFAEAVRAGTAGIMSAYNIVNGTHASANSDALNGLLKTELGFQGFVVSDWGGK